MAGGALLWISSLESKMMRRIAEVQALAYLKKDHAVRVWAAKHGGVYVPISQRTQPNPYLTNIAEKNIATPSGKELTLMNPAYLVRQLMAESDQFDGAKSHLTSLKPIRPANAPTPWEKAALEAFERGVDHVSEIRLIDGVEYLTYMRPIITEESCLKCHGFQGYRSGDIRGGLGVSLPLASLKAEERASFQHNLMALGTIWSLGLAGIVGGGLFVVRRRDEREVAERALKQAEQQLRQSHDLLHYIITHAQSAIAVHDRDLKYVFVSKRYLEQYKVKEQDIIGKHHYEVFPDLPQKWRDVHQRALAGEVSRADEDSYPRQDGTIEWTRWECHPWRLADGSIGGIIIYTEVITDYVRTQQQIRKLSKAIEQGPTAVIITDDAGLIEYVNPKFTQMTGYTLEEVTGKNPRILKGCDTTPEEYKHLWETVLKGGQWSGEFHNRRKNGELYWEAATISGMVDAEGKITHFIAVKEEITERKALEAQVLQSQKLRSIGQLAGGVAHDFNNILASMMMNLSLMQTNEALDEESRRSLDELLEQCQRAANLTRQLLMFSRRSVLITKPVDLNVTVSNLLKMLGRLIGENIEMRFESQVPLPLVEADSGLMEQVLVNLVVNARDAMPKGGRLTISTHVVEFDPEAQNVNRSRGVGKFVSIAVSDSGCGMSAETMNRIFEPFFTTKEAGKGTGLGLATVHGIVAQHKGWVEVQSTLGAGSTFQVFVPVSNRLTIDTEAEQIEPLRRGNQTILVVEDETSLRESVVRSLKNLGYTMHQARSGPEALSFWKQCKIKPDMLFTDMVMPADMTGLELARELLELTPNLKVLISTGYSHELVLHGIGTDSRISFLPKPYTIQVLANAISDRFREDSSSVE